MKDRHRGSEKDVHCAGSLGQQLSLQKALWLLCVLVWYLLVHISRFLSVASEVVCATSLLCSRVLWCRTVRTARMSMSMTHFQYSISFRCQKGPEGIPASTPRSSRFAVTSIDVSIGSISELTSVDTYRYDHLSNVLPRFCLGAIVRYHDRPTALTLLFRITQLARAN